MSDDDSVQTPRNKTMVFTLDERKLLLRLVNQHYEVLNNKKVDSTSTQLKNQAWEAINKEYLEHTTLVRLPRTPQQLKRCWENMKCKAKKGDPMSVKLLRWGEQQYRLQQTGGKAPTSTRLNGSTTGLDLLEDESDSELKEDGNLYEVKVKLEDSQNAANHVFDNLLKINQALETSNCSHCTCDKSEKSARIQLMALEKQQIEELHQLKLQMMRDKIKREKELHKLAVHEMTLKVENERRRAEILEKELNS